MNERIEEALADLRNRQTAGEWLPCPRCGRDTMKPALYTNALSRHADGIHICDECGSQEAVLDFMGSPLPLALWAMFRVTEAEGDLKVSPDREMVADLPEHSAPDPDLPDQGQ